MNSHGFDEIIKNYTPEKGDLKDSQHEDCTPGPLEY